MMSRLTSMFVWIAVPVLALGSAHAFASTAEPSPVAAKADGEPEEIIVEAQRERARQYHREMLRAVKAQQLPRWHQPICVRIIGFDGPIAEQFRDRIIAVAREAEAPVARDRDCDANLLVAWTNDGPDLARRIYNGRQMIMYDVARPVKTRFLTGGDAVRWVPFVRITEAGLAKSAVQTSGFETFDGVGTANFSVNTNGGGTGSLIRKPTVAAVNGTAVIIDAERATGVSLDALADHVAFVALTGIPMTGTVERPASGTSILDLFKGPATRRMAGLTDADRVWLKTLYQIPADRTARWNRGRIARTIEAVLTGEAPVDEPGAR